MRIQSVAVLGAGAVGSYLIWGLSQKPELSLSVIAAGERKERFTKNGFLINDTLYHPTIKTPEEAHGVDLLFVCVKYGALPKAVEDIKTIADDHTIVISLMNGVDSEDVIGAAIGMEHVLPALIKIASERIDNSIRFAPETTIGIIYGEYDPNGPTDRLDAVKELFDGTGIHHRITDVILSEIWTKYRLNVTSNQPQAILGVGVGAYLDSEHVAFIQRKLTEELEAIATAKGARIDLADPNSMIGCKVAKRARYSTLQDLDAKRHTEVDMFAGAMIRMGKELGIPTPYSECVYHMIKALEEKNDGLFDYE